MKHIVYVLVSLFSIISMAGCRTSKSLQKDNSIVEDRQQQSELKQYSFLFDSVCNVLVMSVDSTMIMYNAKDTIMTPNSSNNHPANMKIYGIRLNLRQGQKAIQNAVTTNSNKDNEHLFKNIHQMKQLSKSKISWYWILIDTSVLVLIVVFYKNVTTSR